MLANQKSTLLNTATFGSSIINCLVPAKLLALNPIDLSAFAVNVNFLPPKIVLKSLLTVLFVPPRIVLKSLLIKLFEPPKMLELDP